MMDHVVDTNVIVIADENGSAGLRCVSECQLALQSIQNDGKVLLDDGFRMLKEYIRYCGDRNQAGPGTKFVKWLLQNRVNPSRCVLVHIDELPDAGTFKQFPSHPGLTQFDNNDRKFVAVAAAHAQAVTILQAFDTKWWPLRQTLKACGVNVTFLCPREIQAKYEEKFGGGCS